MSKDYKVMEEMATAQVDDAAGSTAMMDGESQQKTRKGETTV